MIEVVKEWEFLLLSHPCSELDMHSTDQAADRYGHHQQWLLFKNPVFKCCLTEGQKDINKLVAFTSTHVIASCLKRRVNYFVHLGIMFTRGDYCKLSCPTSKSRPYIFTLLTETRCLWVLADVLDSVTGVLAYVSDDPKCHRLQKQEHTHHARGHVAGWD